MEPALCQYCIDTLSFPARTLVTVTWRHFACVRRIVEARRRSRSISA